jgi:hypothetical protein
MGSKMDIMSGVFCYESRESRVESCELRERYDRARKFVRWMTLYIYIQP